VAADPIVALTMAGRIDGERESLGHDATDTADNHGRLSIDCAVTNREITNRDDTGRMVTAGRRVAGGGGGPRRGGGDGGAGPMAGSAGRIQRTRQPPLMMRALRLLEPVARNLIRFIEITIRFRRNRPGIPRPQNEPFFFERRVPSRKSVIEGASRDGVPATVSSSKPMLGSQCLILR
jgi:hypothetical protein